MCYSAMVGQDLKHLERVYGASPDIPQIKDLFERRITDKSIRLPKAMELAFEHPETKDEQKIKSLIDEYRTTQSRQLEQELFKQRKRLADAERTIKTKATKKAMEDQRIATAKTEALVHRIADVKRTELKERDNRIFPMYYSFIVINRGNGHEIIAARYHCRPNGKPSILDRKLPGLYNARRDSLESFWSGLFGKHHAVMEMTSFYENVSKHRYEHRELRPDEAEENLVLHFNPNPARTMTVACLWSHWQNSTEPDLYSFAAITDEPPPEIASAGHDRVVITLKPVYVASWLSGGQGAASYYQMFDDRERPMFEHKRAA